LRGSGAVVAFTPIYTLCALLLLMLKRSNLKLACRKTMQAHPRQHTPPAGTCTCTVGYRHMRPAHAACTDMCGKGDSAGGHRHTGLTLGSRK
jgi:hypothetical protein